MGRGAEKKINGRIERRPFCSVGGAFSQPMPCQGSIGGTYGKIEEITDVSSV
jgi:hypothetical protein